MVHSDKHCSTILRFDVARKYQIIKYFLKNDEIFDVFYVPLLLWAYEIGDPCLQFFYLAFAQRPNNFSIRIAVIFYI